MILKNALVFGLLLLVVDAVAQQPQSTATPREQLQQYVTQLQANPSDDALRTKIIQLALTLDPKPKIPEEATVADGKAKTIFSHATSPDDLKAAAAAFAQASLLAPWVPDYYFNEGAALEKAGQFEDAVRALNYYLLAAPNAPDAGEVRGKIEGIKYEEQKAARQVAEEKTRRQEAAEAQQQAFIGKWCEQLEDAPWLVCGEQLDCMIEIRGLNSAQMCSSMTSFVSAGPVTRDNRDTTLTEFSITGNTVHFRVVTNQIYRIPGVQELRRYDDTYELSLSEDGTRLTGTDLHRTSTNGDRSPDRSLYVTLLKEH